jgi:purine-binding chemotaxis protein CheW
VDIRRIREVIHSLPIRPVPRAPEFVEGVVNLRGEVIPVVDVRRRFGLPASPNTRKTKFLVAHVAGRVLALVVDAVLEVVRIPRSAIRPAPPPSGSEVPRLFLGVCGGEPRAEASARGGPAKLRLLLNVKALLQPIGPEEMAAAREAAGGGEGAR